MNRARHGLPPPTTATSEVSTFRPPTRAAGYHGAVSQPADSYYCPDCQAYRTPGQVRTIQVQHVAMLACGECGRGVTVEKQRVVEPFAPRLVGALAYPFRIDVGTATVATAIMSALTSYNALTAIVGFAAQCMLGVLVLRSAAAGRDKLPYAWDDVDGGLWELLRPAFTYLFVVVICFGPAVASLVALGEAGAPIAIGIGLLGVVYFPAAVLATSLVDPPSALAALKVPTALSLMRRTGSAYALVCGACVGLFVGAVALIAAAARVADDIPVPFLPRFVIALAEVLPIVVGARMLGLLVDQKREELGA